MGYRIGQGFDVHPFAEGRRLVLGGVDIPHSKGLAGHSDADALLHAITDAVLGALGWSDIGTWFPNTDPAIKGAPSTFFLREVWKKASAEGWTLVNCDSMILAERPKIAPFISQMKQNIAAVFDALPGDIGVKATTTEKLGFVGREEGIAASAVVLLEKK